MKTFIAIMAIGLFTMPAAWAKLEITGKGRFVRFRETSVPNPTSIYIRKTSVESVQTYMQDRYMHLELVTSELLSDKGASRYRTYTWKISGGRVEADKRIEDLMMILNGSHQ